MSLPLTTPRWPNAPTVSALVSAVLLGGCALLPDAQPRATPKPIERYDSARALAAPTAKWPNDRWWTAYGDTQLDTLVNEALQGAPNLAVAQARLAQALSAAQVTGASALPQVGVSASVTQQKQSSNHLSPAAVTPQGWNDYGRATLDFSWELDFWGKNRAAIAAATSQAEAARADVAQARLVLATAVVAAYAEFARLHAARDTAAAARDVRAKTAELFRRRHDNGLETLGSVRQVESRRASAEGDLLAIEEQLLLQRHRIAALLGAGPDRGLALARPSVNLDQPFGLPAELSAHLLGRRPDIVAARLRAEAASARIHQARAAFYPNANLVAFAGVQSLGLDQLTRHGSSIGGIGPALSLPIFDGGRLRGQLRGSEAEYAQAVASYDQAVTQALQDVADAAASRQALTAQLVRSHEAVEAARESWRIQNHRYGGGLSTYLDVLAAEDVLLATQRAQTDLQSRSFTLDVALVRALGGGYTTTN
jgi:NodT family efflux transporter outer membrane factor (OMF) lipoprotein